MSSKERVPINLVALGSAAVLSVYAAGYARTQPAAQRLAAEDAVERRPPRPDVTSAPVVVPTIPTAPAPAPAPAPATTPAKKTTPKQPSPTTAAPKETTAPKSIDSTSRPQAPAATLPVTAPPPVAPVQDSARTTAVAPPVATVDTAAKPADAEPVHYKDGTYFGWGTSRHGDIQMGVEIKDGRIKSAFISECNTQYDCSWIYHLPKQVVQRQSAEVDFVSGATQSANALYKAVVNALKQAK